MKPFFTLCLSLALGTAISQKDSLPPKADTATAKLLTEVVVSSSRQAVEVLPDKVVLHMDAQPAAIGETALEALRRAPGVVVDGAENLQMGGKAGVNVYIDGKPTGLSAGDLAGLLKSIEAGNIKKIEVITAPSARYDAAGNAGIINIVLKKSMTNGVAGNLSAAHIQSTHARQNATANLAWRQNKTALFLNASGRRGLQYTKANNERIAGDRTFSQRSIEKDNFNGSSLRVGSDISLNKRSTIGVLWMYNQRYTGMDDGSTSFLMQPAGKDTVIRTRSTIPFTSHRNAFNLNYAFEGAKTQYTLDADYTGFRSGIDNLLVNAVEGSTGSLLSSNATRNDQQVRIGLLSLKGDMSTALSSRIKLEGGAKVMVTRTRNSLQVQGAAGSSWLQDTGRTNFFRYRESISAAYASVRGEGKRLSWQAGLRGEHTVIRGESRDLKGSGLDQPDSTYMDLFPSIFFQYRLGAQHTLGITANRRIDRPSYQDQNPFIYALDALNSEQGNPFLMPQFTNGVELAYTYKGATSIKLSFSETTNHIEYLTYAVGANTIMVPQNAGRRQMLGISLSTPVQVSKGWNAYLSLAPYYHHYLVVLSGFQQTEVQRGGSWGFNGYMSNTIGLKKGWKGSISGWFNFQNRATIYTARPLGSLDLGVQKAFLSDKATFKLSVVDLLNTQSWKQEAVTKTLQLTTYRKWESRNITIGCSWRFGSTTIKKAREREGGGDGERIREK